MLLVVIDFKLYRPLKTWKLPSRSKVISFSNDGKMIAYAGGEQINKQINPNPRMRDNVADTSSVEIRKVGSGQLIQSFFNNKLKAASDDVKLA